VRPPGARCGDEIIDQVIGVEILHQVLEIVQSGEDRIDRLALIVEGRQEAV
jgi:hypothetical protein